MKMAHLIYLLFLFILSCCERPTGDHIFGADEFVIDSYQIKESNFSIDFERQKKPLSDDLFEEYEDTIQENDNLYVVFMQPIRKDLCEKIEKISQSIGFIVNDGSITMPMIGSVKVVGKTLLEAKKKIEKNFGKMIDEVEVLLNYKKKAQRDVELLGMVQKTSIAVDGKMRLFDLLSHAKISADANLYKSYVIRENQMIVVDLYKLIKEGDMNQNIVMRPKDKVYIAESMSANMMILGEVGEPRTIPLINGYLSLKEAITKSKGILATGDKSTIQIFRGGIQDPKVYLLSWQQMMQLPNDSVLVIPGDVVYIAEKPITTWSRFVTQILPTLAGIEMLDKGVKEVGVFMK